MPCKQPHPLPLLPQDPASTVDRDWSTVLRNSFLWENVHVEGEHGAQISPDAKTSSLSTDSPSWEWWLYVDCLLSFTMRVWGHVPFFGASGSNLFPKAVCIPPWGWMECCVHSFPHTEAEESKMAWH